MQIYAVFLPAGAAPSVAAEKAVFIRQGFSWPAFALTPAWALTHGLWLALALWAGWAGLTGLLAHFGQLGPEAAVLVYGLGAFLFGLEADRLREMKLSRDGYLLQGLTLGDNLATGESLFFARAAASEPIAAPAPTAFAGPARAVSVPGSSDLLGLFPSQETKY